MLASAFLLLLNGAFLSLRLGAGSGSFPRPLPAKEERRCVERWMQGDLEARNTLIEHNLRLVAHIIKKYYTSESEQDDLISIGTVGLIKGVSTYRPDKGVRLAYVTLHVGLGTFRPVKEDDVLQHKMHSEHYAMSQETADLINQTKAAGGRVICVGTTSCRTIESQAAEDGTMRASAGWTDIFIYPGYKFKVLDALVTNFHLPESTLIMLVSALAGREHVLAAYQQAVEERYRFFSFGDAMFIQ